MKKTKNKLVASLIAIMLLLVSVIGVTLAWFVDQTEGIKNTFTVGNVDIALYETDDEQAVAPATETAANALTDAYKTVYLPANGTKILPTQTVDKFTYIVNYGDVDVYVGMKITLPKTISAFVSLNLNYDNVNKQGWVLNNQPVDDVDYMILYCVYNTPVAPGEQTDELLTGITVREDAGKTFVDALAELADEGDLTNDFSVEVTGYAVQALGAGNTASEALNKGFSTLFTETPYSPEP